MPKRKSKKGVNEKKPDMYVMRNAQNIKKHLKKPKK